VNPSSSLYSEERVIQKINQLKSLGLIEACVNRKKACAHDCNERCNLNLEKSQGIVIIRNILK
jgi:hypothetical protein